MLKFINNFAAPIKFFTPRLVGTRRIVVAGAERTMRAKTPADAANCDDERPP
jgi:hypothetical protein